MRESNPQVVYLKDYTQPSYWAESVDLDFNIGQKTQVTCVTRYRRNESSPVNPSGLDLKGAFFDLISIELNGKTLAPQDYVKTEDGIFISSQESELILKVVTEMDPAQNSALEGLYKSGDILCTQNEAQGFRRITYFQDRPDVMSVYKTRIEAHKATYPILLSNGNLIHSSDLPNGRHEVIWQDPFKKPCYLYALVAGDLGKISDTFTTRSGRKVALEIFVDKGAEPRSLFAMEALKRSMKWDEDRFNLEYDLDIYMIVAVNSFNAGAMENKGLNIFNSKYVMADEVTATDSDFIAIESVIGHEYFHNWSGNRVTCRDWFQLSLKEGLTVFRDQEFTSDLHSRPVKRIQDVIKLRSFQFPEDSGPMAHPIRPPSYMAINNFYTMTVYEKGSEVVRMIQTILGKEMFTRGLAHYFKMYDGTAATTEDFVASMEQVSGVDLTQFKYWYNQAGTPLVSFDEQYDSQKKSYTLTITQRSLPSINQPEKHPYHIPIMVGLMGEDGKPLSLFIEAEQKTGLNGLKISNVSGKDGELSRVLHLTQLCQKFEFKSVSSRPTLSLLRDFSAPVKLENHRKVSELIFILKNDTDLYSKWEAAQTLALQSIIEIIKNKQASKPFAISQDLVAAFGEVLANQYNDPAYLDLLWSVPDESYIHQNLESVDPWLVREARLFFITELTRAHKHLIVATYNKLIETNDFATDSAKRSLKSTLLMYIVRFDSTLGESLARQLFSASRNMTNRLAALKVLNLVDGEAKQKSLNEFYEQFKNDPVTIDKWLTLKSMTETGSILDTLNETTKDPVFSDKIPNKIYSLLVAFGSYNTLGFHNPDGSGYRFIADWVLRIDKTNPQVSSRLVRVFNQWKKMEPGRRELMRTEIERISKTEGLSANVTEIVQRSLQD